MNVPAFQIQVEPLTDAQIADAIRHAFEVTMEHPVSSRELTLAKAVLYLAKLEASPAMKPKWKPHDDPQCTCDGCNAVTRDATSGIYIPQNAEAWRTVMEAAGISQDGGPVYAQAVTGWKRKLSG